MTPETKELASIQTGGEVSKFEYLQRLGKLLAVSGYFSDVKDQAQAVVKVLAGDELGIPPIAAMMGIYIVKGKVQLGSNLIASQVRRHGYDYRVVHLDAQKCVVEFMGRPDTSGKRARLGESSFSIADAVQAGLNEGTYKKYPRNMLFNRAISNGAKWFTPDVFAGIPVYAEGELSDAPEVQSEHPEVIEHKAEPEPPKIEPMKNPPSFAEKLAAYTREKERVGEKAYYAVLAKHGFEHANEVVKRPLMERQEIYQELKSLPDAGDQPEHGEEPNGTNS